MTYTKPKVRDFRHEGSAHYDPCPIIKVIPSLSFSDGEATIRDTNGARIGGGVMRYLRDTQGNRYAFLITPAVLEVLREEFRHNFFGRSIPARLFAEVELYDFPDEAIENFKDYLFAEYIDPHDGEDDDECWEVCPPLFSKHQYHELERGHFIIELSSREKFILLREELVGLHLNYKGQSTKKYDHISDDPSAYVSFHFIFPKPWVCDRVISPRYVVEGRYPRRFYQGFEYAWYYGRYGIFDDWNHTERPHSYYHCVDKNRW